MSRVDEWEANMSGSRQLGLLLGEKYMSRTETMNMAGVSRRHQPFNQ
ncbi:hypothetical protein [Vulcanisaeta distributa]|nr:hypothetical protein [Vulcanisaeta distributa]